MKQRSASQQEEQGTSPEYLELDFEHVVDDVLRRTAKEAASPA
jgi:hypothetical protein